MYRSSLKEPVKNQLLWFSRVSWASYTDEKTVKLKTCHKFLQRTSFCDIVSEWPNYSTEFNFFMNLTNCKNLEKLYCMINRKQHVIFE